MEAFTFSKDRRRKDISDGNFKLNCGFFGLRNTDQSKKFINDCLSICKNENTIEKYFHDQFLIEDYLSKNKEFAFNNVKIGNPLQQKYWIEHTPNWQDLKSQSKRKFLWTKGDFMIHFGLLATRECSKYELVKKFYNNVVINN